MKQNALFFWVISASFAMKAGMTYASAATIRVPSEQPSIQEAIVAAVDGDVVLVDPGVFNESIDFLGKHITVMSAAGPNVTTIDAGGAAPTVSFVTNETRDAVLEGFTITGGFNPDGGGILIEGASPTVRGNVISNNRACFDGGGIDVYFGSPRIEGNTISHNLVEDSPCGSGVQSGGGISLGGAGAPEIIGNVIENNTAETEGGAIGMFAAGDPIIEANVIRGNMARDGGAISMVNRSDANIINNLIVDNIATGEGGGIHWLVPSGNRGPLLVNNTIAGNTATTGSAIFADGYDANTALANNAIVAEGFGATAIFCGDFNDLNPPQYIANDVYSESGDAYGGACADQTGVNGNISVDPLFTDPGSGDYVPRSGSPLLDSADESYAPLEDIEGNPRPLDGDGDNLAVSDIGAYEIGQASISASVAGFTAVRAVCTNMTTRERVVVRDAHGFTNIDCAEQGLTVNEGDWVRITIIGRVRN